jgi:glycosyltransferase involved in cell wall biosynthesis
MAALRETGIEVEYLRWWDEDQKADLIHYFGRMPADHIRFAQQKGIKVVMAELLTAQGSRTIHQLRVQKLISRLIEHFAPSRFTAAFNWESYQLADAFVALTSWEKHLMEYLFGAARAKVFIVPNGVEEVFFQLPPQPYERSPWLVCTATITERKRVLELAQAAVRAQTPIWIIGKAYSNNDPYAQKFFTLAKQNQKIIRYEGAVSNRTEMAKIYRTARGFVLLSDMESLSLSALEATACECPLLLSDLPWAHATFGNSAKYCQVTKSAIRTSESLRSFYDAAPSLPAPPKPASWSEIARQFKAIYERVLNASP